MLYRVMVTSQGKVGQRKTRCYAIEANSVEQLEERLSMAHQAYQRLGDEVHVEEMPIGVLFYASYTQ